MDQTAIELTRSPEAFDGYFLQAIAASLTPHAQEALSRAAAREFVGKSGSVLLDQIRDDARATRMAVRAGAFEGGANALLQDRLERTAAWIEEYSRRDHVVKFAPASQRKPSQ